MDIVERLRARCVYGDARLWKKHDALSEEAADHIEALRERLEDLRAEIQWLRELMKSDDISQEVWEEAIKLANSDNQWYDPRELIARAIQRAVERERDACAEIAALWWVEPDPDERDPYDDYEMGCRLAARSIASAIRARGK